MPTNILLPKICIERSPGHYEGTSYPYISDISIWLTIFLLFFSITKSNPSLVPANSKLPCISKQSTMPAGTGVYVSYYVVLFKDISYFYASVPLHTTIVPFDAPVYTFLVYSSNATLTILYLFGLYFPVKSLPPTVHSL